MATRKTAKKVSKKAEFSFEIDKPTKSQSNKTKRQMKKLGSKALIWAVAMLVVGLAGGWVGVKFLTKNDCFEIVGQDEITLTVGKSYTDQGVNVVSFGKDLSDKVNIETNLTKNEDGTYTSDEIGTYYIVYTVDSIKYNTIFKVQKIRLITFVEESEQEEITSAQESSQEEVVNE